MISIIVPVYNVRDYIIKCLKSVARQTYIGKMECLIIDDCGQDDSICLAKEFVTSYKGSIDFRILRHEYNRGLSVARNTGIKEAKGEWLYFLDSDDWITDDCIEELTKPLSQHTYDMVVGNYKVVGNSSGIEKLKLNVSDGTYYANEIPSSYTSGKWVVMAWNKLYSTSFIKEQKLYFKEGLVHEDELWSLEIACVAQGIIIVNKETYIYRVRDNSITTSIDCQKRKLEMIKIVYKEFCSFMKEHHYISMPSHFTLYLHAFNLVLWVARGIGNNGYEEAFRYCIKESDISLFDYIHAKRYNLKKIVSKLYIVLPTCVSIHYYNAINFFMYKWHCFKNLISKKENSDD